MGGVWFAMEKCLGGGVMRKGGEEEDRVTPAREGGWWVGVVG